MDIIDIDKLLAPKLGPNKKVININISKPPPKGVRSVMLKVNLTVKDENNKEEHINLVAKKMPSSDFLEKVFNIQDTFKTEVAFYQVIVPILREFQNEENVGGVFDNFAEFYGARFSLDGNTDIVDENGVLLLEDLSVKGYECGNLEIGYDLNSAKSILGDLAKFHGGVIALKTKKPDVFQNKIRPRCAPFEFIKHKEITKAFNTLRDKIKTIPECAHLAEIATNFEQKENPKTCREPFGTIIHFDLWVNNILNKTCKNGKIHNVFVDFQVFDYKSPASDVMFLLWTSVAFSVLEKDIDHLLHHYHQNLVNTIEVFGLETSPFRYENFEEELRMVADYEFGHSLIFRFVFLKHLKIEDGFVFEIDANSEFMRNLKFMITECIKRGWLY